MQIKESYLVTCYSKYVNNIGCTYKSQELVRLIQTQPRIIAVIFFGFLASIVLLLSSVRLADDIRIQIYTNRLISGLFEGALFPAYFAIMQNWLAPCERSKWSFLPLAANRLGLLAHIQLNRLVCRYSCGTLGWPTILYFNCIVVGIWTLVFLIVGSNLPRESKLITRNELEMIENQPPTVWISRQELRDQISPTDLNESSLTIQQLAADEPDEPLGSSLSEKLTSLSVFALGIAMTASEITDIILFMKAERVLRYQRDPDEVSSRKRYVPRGKICILQTTNAYIIHPLHLLHVSIINSLPY